MQTGNAGVSRTAIGELASHAQLNQGKTFSLFGLCSAIGYIVGPLIGGCFSTQGDKISSESSQSLFSEYSYLLPCLVGSCYNILVAGISIPLMQETNLAISQQSLLQNALQNEEGRIGGKDSETDLLLTRRAHSVFSNPESRSSSRDRLAKISCVVGIASVSLKQKAFELAKHKFSMLNLQQASILSCCHL